MIGNLFYTIFALILAVTIISIIWSLVMYFAEMGTEIGKKHQKAVLIASVTALLCELVFLGVLDWLGGLVGL